jgi:hypothetical protein
VLEELGLVDRRVTSVTSVAWGESGYKFYKCGVCRWMVTKCIITACLLKE